MAKNKEITLSEIREAIQKIGQDIAKKEGMIETELNALKKEFGKKDLDDLYSLLKKLNAKVEDLSRDRASLMAQAEEKLAEYGY